MINTNKNFNQHKKDGDKPEFHGLAGNLMRDYKMGYNQTQGVANSISMVEQYCALVVA